METILKKLLDQLEAIGNDHEELFDSDVRQNMSDAIFYGFIRGRSDFIIPDDLGMFSEEANKQVKFAITTFITDANHEAKQAGIHRFHDRLNAVQNNSVDSFGGLFYDDFLGHSRPELFDENGEVIRAY